MSRSFPGNTYLLKGEKTGLRRWEGPLRAKDDSTECAWGCGREKLTL